MQTKNKVFVTPEWLVESIKSEEEIIILDAPYGKKEYINDHDPNKRKYEVKHIPGAIHIDKSEISGKDSDLNLYDAVAVKNVFLNKGVDQNTKLVVYSDGIILAARIAFAAYWLGVKEVYILNGGIYAWENKGYKIESGTNQPTPKASFGGNVPAREEILISTPDDLREAKKINPSLVLASVRSWEEFIGGKSGYPYIEGEGSIPDSVHAKASTNRTNTELLLDDQGNFGNIDKIISEWKKWGIDSSQEVIFYCGAGWRAAVAFFVAKELGWKNIKVFDGGWYQWNKYHNNNPYKYPIQIGIPKS